MRYLKCPLDLRGTAFGHLAVVSDALRLDPACPRRISYRCFCGRCGRETTIARRSLLHRDVKSCARCARERAAETVRLRSRVVAEEEEQR